jgi:hypothetical protein
MHGEMVKNTNNVRFNQAFNLSFHGLQKSNNELVIIMQRATLGCL